MLSLPNDPQAAGPVGTEPKGVEVSFTQSDLLQVMGGQRQFTNTGCLASDLKYMKCKSRRLNSSKGMLGEQLGEQAPCNALLEPREGGEIPVSELTQHIIENNLYLTDGKLKRLLHLQKLKESFNFKRNLMKMIKGSTALSLLPQIIGCKY